MAFPFLQAASLLYGAYRYFTKPKPKSAAYKGGSMQVTATANSPVALVYGNCEVTGNVIYKEETTSATNHLAVGLCEGQINAIESVRINGVNIPVAPDAYEGCSYTPYYGTADQTTDSRFTTSTMTINCAENNFVDEEEPTTVQNWYTTSRLYIEHDLPNTKSMYLFLKFDISALSVAASSDIGTAYLRLYKNSTSLTSNHTVYVYEMAVDSWDETTITWNNKPAFGDEITTISGSLFNGTQEYYDIDITQWVKDTYDYDANKIVGIGMKVVSSSGLAQAVFAARDSAGSPVLKIGYTPSQLAAFAHTAYIALTVVDSALFKGHINDIKVTVQGKLIHDGDISDNYSRTPAWIVYDLLTSARYGADIPTTLINSTSFSTVASYNDTSVTTEDGKSEPRHRCDVVFDDKDSVADRINAVLASFGGFLYTLDGKINIGVDCSGSSAHTFTADNIIDGSFNFWMIDQSQAPNDVSVMYYDAANDFKASYVNIKDQTHIGVYGRNFEEIQLHCINRYSQASRMANYYLKKSAYSQYGCSFRISINNCDVAPGDICTITHPIPGWTSETFRIVQVIETDNDELEVQCEEYDAALYSDDGLPYSPPEGATLPNVNEVPPIITGLTLTESHAQGDDGTYIPQIKVDFTEPDYQFPLRYLIWYKLTASADWLFWELSDDNLAYINVDGAGQYDVRVQTQNQLSNIKTDFGTSPDDTITIAGKTDPPSDVEFNDTNSQYYAEVYLEWLPISDSDLAFYEVRTDTNWGNNTNLVYQGKGTAYVMANPAATSYTFYIKARDLSDNYSDNADSITLTKADPVLGSITTDFTGRDCFLTWEHTEDKDFVKYQIKVYSDAARTALIRTENLASPPYIYTFENNVSDNSGTPIRHPYFTVYKQGTLSQNDSQNCDAENTAPGAPTGLTVTAGMGKLFISWTALAENDITGYNVYAKTTSPADTLVGNITGTKFTYDPEAENTYYVTVAGVDPFGEGTKCSEETQTTNPFALTNYSLDVPLTRGINFSVDTGKVYWTTGTLYYKGAAYTIAAEETGTTDAFIYWDKDSPTVFQHSATAPALDDDVWVMAHFDGTDVYAAMAAKIIHGGLIQASSIEADKMSVDDLSAISANLGTVTSGTVTGATIQTVATATAGIKLDTTSLRSYDANNGIVFEINAATGQTDMRNVTCQTSNVNPAMTVTGHTSSPTASEAAIIIQDNEGAPQITFYDQGEARFNDSVTTGDDFIIDTGQYNVTISATAPENNVTMTIPAVSGGASASFVLTEGAQTVNGVKTFGSFPVTPSSAPTTDYQVANKKYVDDNAGGGPHAVLSATHSDSTAASVVRGDIITGQGAAPNTKWTRLAVGTNGYYLKSDGTDVSWAAVTATPAGSDTHVQYNNGGVMGGEAQMAYNDTTHRLTVQGLASGEEATFSTSTTDAADLDGLLILNSQDAGQNNLGGSIAFAKHGVVTRHCAIVAKQTGSDSDQMGLSIHTHPSTTGSDAMVEAIEINHNGHITLKNNATVFKEIHCPTIGMNSNGDANVQWTKLRDNGSGSTGIYGWMFCWADCNMWGSCEMPQDYKSAATLYPHVHIVTETAGTSTMYAKIGLEYYWVNEDAVFLTSTVSSTEFQIGANANTTLKRREILTSGISGTGKTAGSVLHFRLFRDDTTTATSYEDGIFIVSLDFEYESDKLGSDATTV